MIELNHTNSVGATERDNAIKWLHEKMFDKKSTSCVVVCQTAGDAHRLAETIARNYPYLAYSRLDAKVVWPNKSTVLFVSKAEGLDLRINGYVFECYWLNNIGNLTVIAELLPIVLERIRYVQPSGIITFGESQS